MYFLMIISNFALDRKVQKNTRKLIERYTDRLENSAVSGSKSYSSGIIEVKK